MRNLLIFMLLVAVFVLGKRSCHGIQFGFGGVEGKGAAQSENRTVGDFHAIDLQISGDVEVTVGANYAVEVIAQPNLLPLLKTEVKDGALSIYSTENFNTSENVKIKVTAPMFDRFAVAGSGAIRVMNLLKTGKMDMVVAGSGDIFCMQSDFSELSTSIDGSGTIELGGMAGAMNASISGSGDVKAKGLTANTLAVSVSGSGTVTADVATSLRADVSGSGEVFYSGSPSVESSVSGSGSVKKIAVQ